MAALVVAFRETDQGLPESIGDESANQDIGGPIALRTMEAMLAAPDETLRNLVMMVLPQPILLVF